MGNGMHNKVLPLVSDYCTLSNQVSQCTDGQGSGTYFCFNIRDFKRAQNSVNSVTRMISLDNPGSICQVGTFCAFPAQAQNSKSTKISPMSNIHSS